MTRNKTVTDFLNVADPIEALGQASAIVWQHDNADEAKFLNHPATTNEIQHCLKDLKVRDISCVLGKVNRISFGIHYNFRFLVNPILKNS